MCTCEATGSLDRGMACTVVPAGRCHSWAHCLGCAGPDTRWPLRWAPTARSQVLRNFKDGRSSCSKLTQQESLCIELQQAVPHSASNPLLHQADCSQHHICDGWHHNQPACSVAGSLLPAQCTLQSAHAPQMDSTCVPYHPPSQGGTPAGTAVGLVAPWRCRLTQPRHSCNAHLITIGWLCAPSVVLLHQHRYIHQRCKACTGVRCWLLKHISTTTALMVVDRSCHWASASGASRHRELQPRLPSTKYFVIYIYVLLQDAKVMDQTRGILTHITQACPGRHHAEVEYVTGQLSASMAQAGDTLKTCSGCTPASLPRQASCEVDHATGNVSAVMLVATARFWLGGYHAAHVAVGSVRLADRQLPSFMSFALRGGRCHAAVDSATGEQHEQPGAHLCTLDLTDSAFDSL